MLDRIVEYAKAAARLLTLRFRPAGTRWPPGSLDFFGRVNARPQTHLLDLARLHGRIFKLWLYGGHTTCVVGHALGREMLREHQAKLTGVTIDQRSLYPNGNLRTMQGEEHKHYRRLLIAAVRSVPFAAYADQAARVFRGGLGSIRGNDGAAMVPPDALRRALHTAATETMLLYAFGVLPGTRDGVSLARAFDRLGFREPSIGIGGEQRAAFAEIVSLIRSNPSDRPSFAGHLVGAGQLDDTLLGNLVYMVETVRFDLASLWRWLLYYVSPRPDLIERIREASRPEDPVIRAVVQETLRLNQSEYLLRLASEDISFRGFLVPKGTRLRVCVWEGHKDPANFAEPFAFRPDRFLANEFTPDQFSPFGMDKHHCLGSEFTLDLTQHFLKVVCDGFEIAPGPVAAAIRGKHHWEPNADFTVGLAGRNNATRPRFAVGSASQTYL
jgi:cytochrome P450